MCSGSIERRCLKYIYGLSPFAFALSAMLYAVALACAPLIVLIRTQFFLPMQNGLIARSLAYPYISISQFILRIFLSSSFVKVRINSAFI